MNTSRIDPTGMAGRTRVGNKGRGGVNPLTNVLILFAVAATVIFAVLFSYLQWQGQTGRSAKAFTQVSVSPTATPPPLPTATATNTLTPVPATSTPTLTPTPVPPTATPTPSPTPGPLPPATRIVIPAIGVDAPVVEVSWKIVEVRGVKVGVWDTADNAVGHHNDSANPGENGNVVMSGHHNIKGEVFKDLVELEIGAEIILYAADGKSYRYLVQDNLLIPEADASMEERLEHAEMYMGHTPDPTLTLVSCWPYWGNTHRLIVIAKLGQ